MIRRCFTCPVCYTRTLSEINLTWFTCMREFGGWIMIMMHSVYMQSCFKSQHAGQQLVLQQQFDLFRTAPKHAQSRKYEQALPIVRWGCVTVWRWLRWHDSSVSESELRARSELVLEKQAQQAKRKGRMDKRQFFWHARAAMCKKASVFGKTFLFHFCWDVMWSRAANMCSSCFIHFRIRVTDKQSQL